MSKKLTPAQEAIRKAHNRLMADATRKPAPKPREHKDLGPWTARKVEGAPTPPAQRDPRAQQCPAPVFNSRVGVLPSEVTPMFSAMKPGQYQPGETWASKAFGEAA